MSKFTEEKLLALSKYTDWNIREDIKAELKVDLIILLDKHGYPPITKDDVL